MNQQNGLLDSLCVLREEKSRSISPENFTGEKGRGGMAVEGTGKAAARELGQGWKISPSVEIEAKGKLTLADIDGSGIIRHIWLTCPHGDWRCLILRFYWDEEKEPSIEAPLGDFFCMGWCEPGLLQSLAVCVNPSGGMNCYWPMPFRKHARIELENLEERKSVIYYSIDYAETKVEEDAPYLHAQFIRDNPLEYGKNHCIIEKAQGKGQYVGTYLAWGVNSCRWWGEGEIKFFLDGDGAFPTSCGTGTEDYIGGAWNFEYPKGEYCRFSTPYSGLHQILRPDGLYASQQRFGMYRFHIADPIRFDEDLHVEIQAIGWRSEGRYLPLQDDIASVGFWYQLEPHRPYRPLPPLTRLEVN